MELHGKSILGNKSPGAVAANSRTFSGYDPVIGRRLDPTFYEANDSEINYAFSLAESAFIIYRNKSAEDIASFLDLIAENIDALGDELIARASAETGLPTKRLVGERTRTVGQVRMFGDLVREGSWVEATIDRAQPERNPLSKPDIRRMLIPLGPVVVFGASNFPLAFSVAGGDVASALAARNPVIVKAHPAHPGTSELVGRAIVLAAEGAGMPSGVFSMLQGTSHELSLKVVRHPVATAVGFTGSLNGGRAIFDAASQRPNPIPVFSEMGSVNPVFVLPGALREHSDDFAVGLQQSVTLGVGQFCTCPGLVVGLQGSMSGFMQRIEELASGASPATMVHPGILRAYEEGVRRLEGIAGVKVLKSSVTASAGKTEAGPVVFVTDSKTFLSQGELSQEVFGPSTVIVACDSRKEMMRVARELDGHLTATIHGTEDELVEYRDLVELLQQKVGRLVFNGFPTGVEVCAAMQHGGPYPATTDVRSTSVGAYAIKRFARPVCFQNSPQAVLPAELQNKNHRNIWRMVDNQLTKDDC